MKLYTYDPAPNPRRLQLFMNYKGIDIETTPVDLASGEQLKAPDWLSERAQAEWDELALRLHGLGLLTEIDLDVFAAYCVTWSNWRAADELVEQEGATTVAQSGYQAVSPHVTRAKNHLAEVIKLSSLLGLSPSARTRIEASPMEAQEDDLLA